MEIVGTVLDGFRIIRLVGKGGMGQIFEALDESEGIYHGRRVAIKMLRKDLLTDGEIVARFKSEARALGAVQDPGLCELYHVGEMPWGGVFFAMEFLEGESLRQLQRDVRLAPADLFYITGCVAKTLAAVHEKRIIHRDLKPDNVMILDQRESDGRRRVKVIDFGIAKFEAVTRVHTQIVTRSGVMLGTPTYMAPEQCLSGDLSDRCDVYALGVMLYEMLAGAPPFVSESDLAVMGMHIHKQPVSLLERCPHISANLAVLVHCMLHKHPRRRPSMLQVAKIIETLSHERIEEASTQPLVRIEEEPTFKRESGAKVTGIPR